jgi:hypothetical protein
VTYLRRHLTAEVELRAARDAALEASVIKTRFVTTASHDFPTFGHPRVKTMNKVNQAIDQCSWALR